MADTNPFLRLYRSYERKILRPVTPNLQENNQRANQCQRNISRLSGIKRKTLNQFLDEIGTTCKRQWWVHQIVPLGGSITDSYFNGRLSTMERAETIIRKINGRVVKSAGKSEENHSEEEDNFRRLFGKSKNVTPSGKYKGQVIFIAIHERPGADHLHIIHDCTNSARTCKCAVFDIGLLKRHADKKSKERSGGSNRFIKDFAIYSVIRRQSYNYIYTPGYPIGYLFENRSNVGGSLSLKCAVEGEKMDSEYRCFQDEHSDDQLDQSNSRGNSERDREGPRQLACNYKTQFQKTVDHILKFFDDNLISPISKCTLADNWLKDDKLLYITDMDREFKVAIDIYKRKIRKMRIPELYDHYTQPGRTVYFNCVDEGFSQKFWSVEESHAILDHFLTVQFGDLVTGNEFVHYLYYFLTRQTGKKNCCVITGNPNGGKSYLINSISSLMVTVGKTTVVNKNNTFCFSGFGMSSLIVMDEMTYEPFFLNEFKKMFSGEDTNISVKYKDPVEMGKTPCIVLNNDNNIIPHTPAFTCRCVFVHFSQQFSDKSMFRKNLHPWVFCERWKQLGKGDWPKYEDQFTNKYLMPEEE